MILIFLIILSLLITFGVSRAFAFDDFMFDHLWSKTVAFIAVFIIAGAICGLCSFGALAGIGALVNKQSVEYGSWELQQVRMGEGIKGEFFLGSGVINGESVYTAYYKNNGGFQSWRGDADEVLVIENDSTPRLVQYNEILPWWVSFGDVVYGSHFEIYVPEGSIAPMVDVELPD